MGNHPPRHLPFADLVRARRSVRAYRPDPVPRARVEQVLEATLHPHALVTLGYAAQEPIRRERLPLAGLVVRFE
ncbi:MAG TPA: nitroreductase family protein [Chloroflexota bacterium]|nr:nitroreductase family protein [Chloroflexota bacterium]